MSGAASASGPAAAPVPARPRRFGGAGRGARLRPAGSRPGDAGVMTDLANVWVRASRLELVRADRIVSLLIGDPTATGGGAAQLMTLVDLRAEQPGGSPLRLMALVAGGAEPREVHLRGYEASDAVPALVGLASALAAAAGRSEPVLFVYPGPGADDGWEITTALPREWLGGPSR